MGIKADRQKKLQETLFEVITVVVNKDGVERFIDTDFNVFGESAEAVKDDILRADNTELEKGDSFHVLVKKWDSSTA